MNEALETKNKDKKKLGENSTLIELITGIVLFGILSQIVATVIIIMKHSRFLYYSIGIWAGIAMAIGCALHMNYSISKVLDFGEADAIKLNKKYSLIRYFSLCIIFAVIMIFDFISPLTAFLGIMGLKIGAYLNPFIHKAFIRLGLEEPDPEPKSLEELEKEAAQQAEKVEESGS